MTDILRSALKERARDARPVEYRAVTFNDGSQPQLHDCYQNVLRWVAEHPRCIVARGWFVTSESIFDKHFVVEEGSELFDITPLHDPTFPRPPFLRHLGADREYGAFLNQEVILY